MLRRSSLGIAALVVLAALLVVALSSGDGSERDAGRAAAPEQAALHGTGELAEQGGGVERERHTVAPPALADTIPPARDAALSFELGIPSFRGRLLFADGSPAAAATVQAWGIFGYAPWVQPEDPTQQVLVDWTVSCSKDGRFALPEAPADGLRFVLRATSPGAPPLEISNLPALPGRTRDLGELRFSRGYTARGTVSDALGRPIAAARVTPLAEPLNPLVTRRPAGSAPLLPGYECLSDAGGQFLLENLPPGRLRLRAAAAGYAPALSAPVHGAAGERVDELALILTAAQALQGRIVDAALQPIAGALVRLEINRNEHLLERSAADGSFSFAPPETIEQISLNVWAAGFWPRRLRPSAEERSLPVEIRLETMPPLSGAVRTALGPPVAGATVKLVEQRRIREFQGDPEVVAGLCATASGADGGFQMIPDLSKTWERRFVLVASAPGCASATSPVLSFDDRNSAFAPVILVLDPGAEISGRVAGADGQTLAGARVHLRKLFAQRSPGRRALTPPTRRSGALYRAITSGAGGEFRFRGVPPGDWRVEAHHPAHSPGESAEFTLSAEPVELLIQLPPPAAVAGVVVGDRSSFGPLRVTATSPDADPLDAMVDAAGGFSFEHVPPAVYSIVMWEIDPALADFTFVYGAGDGLARADGVTVAAGTTAAVTLELDAAARAAVYGRVTVNGKPAAELSVFLILRDLGGAADPRQGWRSLTQGLRSATTDVHGRYQLSGVEPDDYWLLVQRRDNWPEGLQGASVGAGSQGPSGLLRRDLELRAGTREEINLDLLLGAVQGRAVRRDGQQTQVLRGGSGSMRPQSLQEGCAERSVQVNRDGTFFVDLLPRGHWSLSLRSGNYEIRDFPVTVDADYTNPVEVVLERRPPDAGGPR